MFSSNSRYVSLNFVFILYSSLTSVGSTHQYDRNTNESYGINEYTYNLTEFNEAEIDCSKLVGDSVFSSKWFQVVILVLYISVFIIALLGNGLVCYVVYKSPNTKSVTNYFIVNLAVGDILIDLFCVPTSLISTVILQYWPFGSQSCPTIHYLQAVAVLVSAYTLVPISIDRYIGIMWPLRPRMNKNHAKLSILTVWVLALVIAFPILVYSQMDQPELIHKKCDVYVCMEKWPTPDYKFYYTVALMILQYLVPSLILLFTYSSIIKIICSKEPPGEAENTRDERRARSKKKMIQMMLAVVLVFSICWLPFNLLNLLMDKFDAVEYWSGLAYTWVGLHWLAMSHACYNPIIYCWMNTRFRTGFLVVICRLPLIKRIRRINESNASMVIGMAPTGNNGQTQYSLRRVNTCTTYVSVPRRNLNSSQKSISRSASVRNHSRTSTPIQRHFVHLETQAEESV